MHYLVVLDNWIADLSFPSKGNTISAAEDGSEKVEES